MFKCTGKCDECGKCKNIYDEKILKEIIIPDDFKYDTRIGEYGVAFDIGTTTIAGALWDLEKGKLIVQSGATNPQRNFGADVISRISYCIGNHERIFKLQHPLRMTIRSMINYMCEEAGISFNCISKTAFCGNTAMMLLFAGMPVDGIAAYPFTPEHIDGMVVNSKFSKYNIEGYMLPNIGGHIGGDIAAGILSTRINDFDGNAILVDIGTNGEVILKIEDKLYGFSTAAGPAFEGANIECGMSGTQGAIELFKFTEDEIKYQTIGNSEPIGICGSGIISAIVEMKKKGIIDNDGKIIAYDTYTRIHPYSQIKERILEDRFVLVKNDEKNDIVITQNDIRELQLAKASIKAGINILLNETGNDMDDIDKVYLAGGFGINTPTDVLLQIGILPEVDKEKIEIVGNSALAGTSMVLLSNREKELCEKLSKEVGRVELSIKENFQKEFLKALKF